MFGSSAESKGSDCFEPFKVMQECMAGYPTLYGNDDKPEEDSETPNQGEKEPSVEAPSSQDVAKT